MSDAASASARTGPIRVAVSASAFDPATSESAAPDWARTLRRALEQHVMLTPMGVASRTGTADDEPHGITEPGGWVVAEGASRLRLTRGAHLIVPIEDAESLRDPDRRNQFILRTRIHHRWQCRQAGGLTRRGLVAFQAEHKYLLLAHAPERARRLGQLAAEAGRRGAEGVADDYARDLMAALAEPADRRGHYNAMQHAAGHVRGRISDADRAKRHDAIDGFFAGEAALAEPLCLLRDLARQHGSDWLARPRYLHERPWAEPGPR